MKRLAYVLLGLVGLLVTSIVAALVLLQTGYLNPLIERQASAALGREVRLREPPSLSLGWQPALTLGGLSIGNPPGIDGPPTVALGGAEAAVSLSDLVRGEIVIPRVIVEGVEARLVRVADGRANWEFGARDAPEEPASDEPLRLPRVDLIELRQVKVGFEDAITGRELEATLDGRMTPDDGRSRLVADLSVADLRPGAPGAARPHTLHLEGFIDDPQAPQDGFELSLTGANERAHELLALAGVPVAGELPGVTLDLRIARDAAAWHLRNLDLRLGEARVAGRGSVRDLASLDGLDFAIDGDVPEIEPLLVAFGLPPRPVPPLALDLRGTRQGERNEVRLDGTFGDDSLRAVAGTEGPLAELRGLRLETHIAGTQLGRLLPLLGLTEQEVPAYRLDGTVGREGDNAARVDVTAALGDTRFGVNGLIGDIQAFRALDLQVALAGQDPSEILDIFGLPEISLPPYDIEARLGREGDVIRVRDLAGRVGDSDLGGDASVDLARQPVAVVADLASDRLDFDDLAGLIGLPPSTEGGEAASPEQEQQATAQEESDRLLPDVTIDAAAWRYLNLDVRYRGRSVEAPNLPFQDLAFHVVTREGWITLDPFQADIAGGRLIANASLDGSGGGPIDGDFDIRVQNLQLNEFLRRFGFENEALGTFGGRAELTSTGGSLRDLAAAADGRVALTLEGGRVDELLPELAGLDVGPSGVTYLGRLFSGSEGQTVPLRCMIADFGVTDGVMNARTVLIDTPEDKMTLQGSIDLRAEELDLMFHAFPREASLGSSRQPISIEGPIKSPTISPAPGYVENQTLGWVLSPLAALLPFVELGAADDRPCAGVVDRVREEAAQ